MQVSPTSMTARRFDPPPPEASLIALCTAMRAYAIAQRRHRFRIRVLDSRMQGGMLTPAVR